KSHFEAAKLCRDAYDVAFGFIADEIKSKGRVLETAVQARIIKHFADSGMTTYSPPIVGVGAHSGDPHFDTSPETDTPIQSGAHIDGLETRDDRRIIRRTCFSIEPGIYLPEFGVRSEVDVYIDATGRVHVTGGEPQREVHKIIV